MSLYVQHTRVHCNHLLCPTVPNFMTLCVQYANTQAVQKVASNWACMCSILRVHSNHLLCPTVPEFTHLICSVTKKQAVK